jgi:hypothetical protein
LLADLLHVIHEQGVAHQNATGIAYEHLSDEMQKLEDKTAEVTTPICRGICSHTVGACVFIEGVQTLDPHMQPLAERAQEQVAFPITLARQSPDLIYNTLQQI